MRNPADKASALIVEDPEILRRTPVNRNISIPIHYVGEFVTAGITERLDPRVRDVFTGEIGTVRLVQDSNENISGVRVECNPYSERANQVPLS